MLERFTPSARQVMELADQEADRLHHNYVGPEHVLAGITSHGDSPAARVLRGRGLDAEAVRAELDRLVEQGILLGPYRDDHELLRTLGVDLGAIQRIVEETFGSAAVEQAARRVARRPWWRGGGTGREPPWPPLPTPTGKGMEAQRALHLAGVEAEGLGQHDIAPEHVLLGVLRDARDPAKVPRCFRLRASRQFRAHFGLPDPERPSPVTAVIASQGLTVDELREAVLTELHATA